MIHHLNCLQEVSVSSMTLNALEKEHPCEYLVGDLVWVHIRGSPLWPSMISYDPFIGEYSRLSCECYCEVWVKLILSCLEVLLKFLPISIIFVLFMICIILICCTVIVRNKQDFTLLINVPVMPH